MNKSPIKVLYVDDEKDLLDVTRMFLKKIDENIDLDTAISARKGLEMIVGGNYDAIISDYEMPDINGIEFLKIIKKEYPHLPFIIFTGRGREEVVMEALNLGADFYIQKGSDVKSQFAELVHKLRIAVTKNRYKTALHDYNERLSLILGSTNIGLLDYDCNTGNAFFSPNYFTMLGYDTEEISVDLQSWKSLVHPEDRDLVMNVIENINANNNAHETDFRIRTKEGDYKWFSSRGKVVEKDQNGNPIRIVGVHTDITTVRDAKEGLKEMEDVVKTSIKGNLSMDDLENIDFGANSDETEVALSVNPAEAQSTNDISGAVEKTKETTKSISSSPFSTISGKKGSIFYAVGLSNTIKGADGEPICDMVSFYYTRDIDKNDENN